MRETAQRPRPGLRIAGRGSRWSATRCGGSPSSMPPWSATTRELRRRPGSPGPGRARADGGDARRVAVRAEPDGLPRRRCRLHRAAGRRRRIGRRRGYRMDVEAASRAGARPAAAARAGMGAGTVPGLSRLAGRSHDRGGVRAGRAFLALASAAARPGRSRSCRAGAVNGAQPGPLPSRQARGHRSTNPSVTRRWCAIWLIPWPRANRSAARSRSSSRRRCPAGAYPPAAHTAYRHPLIRPQPAGVTT